MRIVTTMGLAVLLVLGASVSGYGQKMEHHPAGVKVEKTAAGDVFANDKGMTLYTFDNDTMAGKSACNGPCAVNWPPLAAMPEAKPKGAFTVVTRDDGSKQWAYKGKPLYTWMKDSKPGDMTGEGFKNVWHVAKP
ncbi:MAG: hypothetical protein ABSD13_02530 [Candidatus Korobacteraceae bacterium]|jgi:predicted lipoprotein with Yx(FWY)xxD motif